MKELKLQKVEIYPHCMAGEAEGIINRALEACLNEENIDVNYELMIENSTQMGQFYDTRYTLVIHYFTVHSVDDYEME